MKNAAYLLSSAVLTILIGCASIDKFSTGMNPMPDEAKRKELVAQFPDLNAAQKEKFVKGEPWIGMSQPQFEAMLGGPPLENQRKLSSAGQEDTQFYGARVGDWKSGTRSKYFKVKMLNGKLAEHEEVSEYRQNLDKLN